MMNEEDIRKYAVLMQELGLTGLEVTENDRVVRLERTPAAAAAPQPPEVVQVPAAPAAPAAEPPSLFSRRRAWRCAPPWWGSSTPPLRRTRNPS